MIEKDENGRRRIGTEIEVPGTPEEVWEAIASGEGISSWFYRSQVDGRVGGTSVCDFGPGMEAREQITEWHPPTGFTSAPEAGADAEEGAPSGMATEWLVQARDGGSCIVRVVHSWFADSDDWDGQFEAHVYGWGASFFPMLRLYLRLFKGQRCAPFQFTVFGPHTGPKSMGMIKDALGIGAAPGRFASRDSAPELSGHRESLDVTDPDLLALRGRSPYVVAALDALGTEDADLLLRLEQPAPGFAYVSVTPMDEQAMVSVRVHLFGDEAVRTAARAEREWNDWLTTHFPAIDPAAEEPTAVGE